jgi:hypothetical protein
MRNAKAMKRAGKYGEARVTRVLAEAKLTRRQQEYQLLRQGRSVNELVTCPLLKEVG